MNFNKIKSFAFVLTVLSLNVKAQTVNITTGDIVSNIVGGSTTGSITKGGVTFTVTKTGGSTSPVNATFPTGAPLNTLPLDGVTNIEGLHLGRTWGANGTGWVDAFGQLRTEQYTLTFSNNLEALSFVIGALNENADGIERLRIVDVRNGATSVLASVSFGIRIDVNVPESDSL